MDTRELFARLIRCEAGGEGLNGMRAMATVVMNRAKVVNGEYFRVCQGDLRKVIMQACQFSCYKTVIGGKPHNQNVWVLTPEDIHFQVADWAMNGGTFTGVGSSALWFMNPFSPDCPDFFPYNKMGVWLVYGINIFQVMESVSSICYALHFAAALRCSRLYAPVNGIAPPGHRTPAVRPPQSHDAALFTCRE